MVPLPEGWERDFEIPEPSEPSFTEPDLLNDGPSTTSWLGGQLQVLDTLGLTEAHHATRA